MQVQNLLLVPSQLALKPKKSKTARSKAQMEAFESMRKRKAEIDLMLERREKKRRRKLQLSLSFCASTCYLCMQNEPQTHCGRKTDEITVLEPCISTSTLL